VGDQKYTIDQLCDDPSFIRWAEGDLSGWQARRWNQWVQKSEKNRDLAKRAQQKISGFSFETPPLPEVNQEWKKVHREIVEGNDKRILTLKTYGDSKRDILGLFIKVAAAVLVGAFIGLAVYLYPAPVPVEQPVAVEMVKTDYGEKRRISLSDGSMIVLSANSTISFKENWLEKPVKRISLEGEAYFSIVPGRDKKQPKLVVETEDGSASVWGTRFTVDTYGIGTRIVLAEGEVRVLPEKGKQNNLAGTTMKPGEMVQFSELSRNVERTKVNPKVYTSWSANKLFFDNTPLSVLVNRIERVYGVEVNIENPDILQQKLSGSVDFRSLEGLTAAVAEIFEIQIHQSGETLTIKQ